MKNTSDSNIVIVSYDASRTGAPILLLSFLQAAKAICPEIVFKLFLFHGGPLLEDFQKCTETEIIGSKTLRRLKRTRLHRVFTSNPFARLDLWLGRQKLLKYENAPWYLNTFPAMKEFSKYGIQSKRLIWHFRELESSVVHFGSNDDVLELASRADWIIPDSHAVKNYLKAQRVDNECIHVIHEYIDTSSPPSKSFNTPDKFIVAGSGSPIWRKGFDIFITSAITYNYQYPNNGVEFHWYGKLNENVQNQAKADIKRAGFEDKVILHGLVSNPIEAYAGADLFFATTREEPFGLVVLEAALGKVPCLAMAGVGGLNEFIEHEELSIPYLDINSAIVRIHALERDRETLNAYGEYYYKKVRNEYDVHKATTKILNLILDVN